MCCFTHDHVEPGQEPPDPRMQCQCGVALDLDNGFGPCQRVATAEDLMCDICGGRESSGAIPLTPGNIQEVGQGEFIRAMEKKLGEMPIGEMWSDVELEIEPGITYQWKPTGLTDDTPLTIDLPATPDPDNLGKYWVGYDDIKTGLDYMRRRLNLPPE